jgi:hypothetical protein
MCFNLAMLGSEVGMCETNGEKVVELGSDGRLGVLCSLYMMALREKIGSGFTCTKYSAGSIPGRRVE